MRGDTRNVTVTTTISLGRRVDKYVNDVLTDTWSAILEAEGKTVLGREISVRSADDTLRRYDLVVEDSGDVIGVEVKSGTARRTAQQRAIDQELMDAGGMRTVGGNARKAGIDWINSVMLMEIG